MWRNANSTASYDIRYLLAGRDQFPREARAGPTTATSLPRAGGTARTAAAPQEGMNPTLSRQNECAGAGSHIKYSQDVGRFSAARSRAEALAFQTKRPPHQ